jgi:hypothetical protein
MQENKFNVGDKVRYIGKTIRHLKSGEEYTVCGLIKNFGIILTGVESWWNVCRFEIVESSKHDQETCTVEEVIKAFINVYPIGWEVVNVEEVIQKTKQELEKRKNPEYLKYLELKEKFEPRVF